MAKVSNSGNSSVLKATENNLSCFFCKRDGHIKRDCQKYKSWKERKEKENKTTVSNKVNKVEQNNEFLFMVSSRNLDDWIIDSGATSHVTSNKRCFDSFERINSSTLNVANGEKVHVQGKGTCKVEFINSDGVISCAIMTDVLYAPQINGNLLSVKKLIDKGF